MPQSEANAGISPACDEMPFLFLRIVKGNFILPHHPGCKRLRGGIGFILTSSYFKFIVIFLHVKSNGRRRI